MIVIALKFTYPGDNWCFVLYYHYINMIVVCPSVHALWKVSENDLTSRHKALYL